MVIAFEPAHLDAIDLSEAHRSLAQRSRPAMELLARTALASSIVVGEYDEQEVVAVLGAATLASDECEVFIFPSVAVGYHALALVKGLRQELRRMRARFAKIRALSNSELSATFLRRLGFTFEGICERPGAEGRQVWIMQGGVA